MTVVGPRRLFALVALATVLVTGGCTADDEPSADDPLFFLPPVPGAELVYRDAIMGDVSDTTMSVVSVDSHSDGDGRVVQAEQRTVDGGLTAAHQYLTRSDGSLVVDSAAFLVGLVDASGAEGMTVTASGDEVVVPAIVDLEGGASTSGAMTMDLTLGEFRVQNDTTFTITGGGHEQVTVPYGSFEAYRVDVALEMETSLGASATGTMRGWFVPGFAWVRHETHLEGVQVTRELVSSTVTS